MRKCKIGYPLFMIQKIGIKIPFHIRRVVDGLKTDLYVAMLPMMHYHLVKYFDFHLSIKRMCFSIKSPKPKKISICLPDDSKSRFGVWVLTDRVSLCRMSANGARWPSGIPRINLNKKTHAKDKFVWQTQQ